MRRIGYRRCALALGALLVGLAAVRPAGVRAATVAVSSCDQAGLTSAISAAGSGGTVQFTGDCTITLTSTITLDQSVTIDGNGHAVTISGGHTATVTGVGVLLVNPGVAVTLNDLTIANGNGGNVGGIVNLGTLTVTNSSFSGNSTSFGGGIENTGTLSVSNSTFRGNSAGSGGGGIDNTGTLSVIYSTFSGNSAGSDGGGIENYGTLSVIDSTFSGNSAGSGGGGIESIAGAVTVSNSAFSGNSAGSGGGGIDIIAFGTLTVSNSTFSGNSAGSGGGIANALGSANLTNTIVANSTAGGDCAGSITDHGGNLADDGTCGFSQSSSKNNAAGLNLGPLADNGGPTQTIALQSGSVAIAFTSTNCPAFDQRGYGRPSGATSCDSGSYQSAYVPVVIAIAPNSLPAGQYGTAYSQTLSASSQNDSGPFSFRVVQGTLPAGLRLDTNGTISGTPTAPGSTSFTVQASDANGHSASLVYQLTINQAPLSITADNQSMTYGGALPALTASFSGFVNGDTAGVLSGSLTCTTTATSSSPVGSYPISCSGQTSSDYTITYVNGTLTITKANQTISFGPLANKTYGDAPFAASATASSGLPVSFTASGACTIAGSTVTITGAGSCAVTASQAGDTNHNAAPSVQQGFSSAKALLTVAANNQQMVLHGTVPALTASYSGFVNGDTGAGVTGLSCTTTATSSSPVGAYPITCSGAVDPNYTVSYKAGTLNVTYQAKALYNQTGVNKSGTSVAIKLQLLDAKGTNLSSSGVVVTLSAPALAPSPSPGAQPSGAFTFMPTGDAGPMYQYNVKSTSYPAQTYTLSFTMAQDPVTHTVQFVIG